MFVEWVTCSLRPGAAEDALAVVERMRDARLLGCWTTVMGDEPRLYIMNRAGDSSDHATAAEDALSNSGPLAVGSLCTAIRREVYATLPCLPEIASGALGGLYEIRTYELQPAEALALAREGWRQVLDVRLAMAPVAAVMHSVQGLVPRLVHIYPYKDLADRRAIRDRAVATGLWPPKGGAQRNRIMATELAIPAPFSPLH